MTDPTPTRSPRFFVAHMQKTAGTTLRERLTASFSEDQIYPNATDGADPRVSVISLRHLQARWAERGHEIRLLTGHFPVRTTEVLDSPDPWVTMTIFRDPIERVLSFLRHQAERRQRGATEDTPIEEIYADPFRFDAMIQNHMTRAMSLGPDEWGPGDGVLASVAYDEERLELAKRAVAGLDAFGLQHRLDEFCDELGARYGLDTGEPRRSNTTEAYEVPASFRDRIAEDNALDVALYEYACDLYEQRHPATATPGT